MGRAARLIEAVQPGRMAAHGETKSSMLDRALRSSTGTRAICCVTVYDRSSSRKASRTVWWWWTMRRTMAAPDGARRVSGCGADRQRGQSRLSGGEQPGPAAARLRAARPTRRRATPWRSIRTPSCRLDALRDMVAYMDADPCGRGRSEACAAGWLAGPGVPSQLPDARGQLFTGWSGCRSCFRAASGLPL